MLMRATAWLVLFCMTANVFASTGSVKALERAIDDYQYAVTVEWDQKDQSQYDSLSVAFTEKLQSLITEEGLTKADINSVLEKKVGNKNQLSAMKAKLGVLSGAASAQEMVSLLSQNSKELYSQGASWNGDAENILIYGGIALLIGGLIWFYATHECVATAQEYSCTSSYDQYGGSSRCGYNTVCTAYQKK